MNSNQPKLDPLSLQRLVDGELDTRQVQEILLQAQDSPEHWKSIAVGFIENQTWENALNSSFAQPVASRNTTLDSWLEQSRSRNNAVNEMGDELETVAVPQAAVERNPQQRAPVRWLAIAASLLAAASIGYMANQIQNRNLPNTSIAETRPANDFKTPVRPAMTATKLTPDFHVEMPQESGFGGHQGRNSNGQVPVYRVTNTDQLRQLRAQRAIESEFPRRIIEQLSNSGYQIEQEIEFVSGQVDDQSFVVPLRTIRLIPGQ